MTQNKFFRILKEKGVYSSFLKYIKRKFSIENRFTEIYGNNLYSFINNCIRSGNPHTIIMEGFTWDDTAEGEDFWSELYTEIYKRRNEK